MTRTDYLYICCFLRYLSEVVSDYSRYENENNFVIKTIKSIKLDYNKISRFYRIVEDNSINSSDVLFVKTEFFPYFKELLEQIKKAERDIQNYYYTEDNLDEVYSVQYTGKLSLFAKSLLDFC